MTKVIAIGGKKKSGKGLAATYLSGLILSSRQSIIDFRMREENENHCIDLVGDNVVIKNRHINSLDPKVVKIYSFADELKRIANKVFGIDNDLLYGNEEKKNSYTKYLWKDMPGVITNEDLLDKVLRWQKRCHDKIGRLKFGELPQLTYKPDLPMTVRELLQFLGTDIFRSINSQCWCETLYKDIEKDRPEFAIIADMRFDNEVAMVQSQKKNYDSLVVRLLRDISNNSDSHVSENGFSDYIDWDITIDNTEGTSVQMCQNLIHQISQTNFLKPK